MAVTEVVLPVPSSPNLGDLAESTSAAFKLLRPWCHGQSGSSSVALRSIASQAQKYVRAIDCSVTAAQHGFNIAIEALTLAEMIPKSTEKEHQEYLVGMMAMVLQGQGNAQQAYDSFRSVRKTLEDLITAAKDEHKGTDYRVADKLSKPIELKELEAGIVVLERFSECVSIYANWWNEMCMTEISQKQRLESVVFKYNSLRERAVIGTWRQLKQEYVDYSNKIMALQDQYPEYIALANAPDIELEAVVTPAYVKSDQYSYNLIVQLAALLHIGEYSSRGSTNGGRNMIRKHRHRSFRQFLGLTPSA